MPVQFRDYYETLGVSKTATEDEIRATSLQYVRKISGFNKPSRANEEAFERAIDAVAQASAELLEALQTTAPSKNRRTALPHPPGRIVTLRVFRYSDGQARPSGSHLSGVHLGVAWKAGRHD